MKWKLILAGMIVLTGIILAAVSFWHSSVEYGDFAEAKKTGKKIQIKGEWASDRETRFDLKKNQFMFYLKDDRNEIEQVVLDGVRPNNFELAKNLVVKGRYADGCFRATEVLTKCPSKYESLTTPDSKSSKK